VLVAPLQRWRGVASAPLALPTVLIDDRHPEARVFGGALAGRGAQVHAVPGGDVSALWRESIGPAWRNTRTVVAGLTRPPVLFCLEQLGWPQGLRVVFHAEHRLAPSQLARHTILRAASARMAAAETALSGRGRLWPGQLAALVVSQGTSRIYRRAAFTEIDLAPALPIDLPVLTSWIIAPV